ncbi:MAG: metallopeptidase family protein [Chloroflexi bacterium]|nr:metallopeptidase family protein [Chloroflexota bacterium]
MTSEEFERVIADTLTDLPPRFQERLDNVAIVVEEWPDAATLEQAGVSRRDELLGFYHGIPLTARTQDYGMVLPDKISIFQQ